MASRLTSSASGRAWTPLDASNDVGGLDDDGQRSGTVTPTHEDSRLLSPSRPSATSFISSPLNPTAPHSPRRLASHGSMILYRLADDPTAALPPPTKLGSVRTSLISTSGDSYTDSKYPSLHRASHALIPYEYDPSVDQMEPPDDEDLLHDPRSDLYLKADNAMPWRGILNVGLLILIIIGLLTLFIFYPVYSWYHDLAKFAGLTGNLRINGTGQSPLLIQLPELIDQATPDSAKTRTGYDGQQYELVFSDEFEQPGRTFYPGDDPFWEAVDIWYGSTADLEWYDPVQVTTRGGALVITMDSTATTQAGMTPNSTAPFTTADNHNLTYRSGMLQSWNKFCFTTGYLEVAVTFPGPNENTQGYWPGAWTMGNLGRPGYLATTGGMWPYTYDSCDVGTFPNQTYSDGSGPAAALHSDASRAKYNFDLSWLPGQRASACSCPGSDHPGPSPSHGRGAPEIDVFEVEKDKGNPTGQVASQSAQFAPFTHDYDYLNSTNDQFQIYNTSEARPNTYKGSAVQQAVSCLAKLPSDMFQGSGQVYHTMGFEYHSDPSNRQTGFITWQVDGAQTYTMGAGAVGPDTGSDGSQVGQRLIPEEPMSIVLNLGMSANWQSIDLSTMMFPAELRFDYVRVYQRKGQTNIGCNPKNYPTTDYINNHIEAYTNPNMTTWSWPIPKNSAYSGGC
ncbi:hypothetical protein APHAL10511_008699 [Amanita phalloides]|nr:hypothetical protein APHAL10511_008699 [Amanita phalloides]